MKLKFSFHFHSFLLSIENLNQAATFEFALGLRTHISSTLALLPVSRLGNLRTYLIVAIKKNVVVHLFGPQSESTLQKNKTTGLLHCHTEIVFGTIVIFELQHLPPHLPRPMSYGFTHSIKIASCTLSGSLARLLTFPCHGLLLSHFASQKKLLEPETKTTATTTTAMMINDRLYYNKRCYS